MALQPLPGETRACRENRVRPREGVGTGLWRRNQTEPVAPGIPLSQDGEDELAFLTANDTLRSFVPVEDMEVFADFDDSDDSETTLAERLLQLVGAKDALILGAAKRFVGDPYCVVEVYEDAIKLTAASRRKIFIVLQRIVSAVIYLESAAWLKRELYGLAYGNGTEISVLAHLVQLARNEGRHGGYGHYTAAKILKALGYEDPTNLWLSEEFLG